MLDLETNAEGNDSATHLLQHCYEQAKLGRVNHACVILCEDGQVKAMFSGHSAMEPIAYWGAGLLQKSLQETCMSRMLPPSDGPAERMIYNLARMPVNFDFVGALIDGEMCRRREGRPGPLRVAWHIGHTGNTTALLHPQQQHNFEHILRPLVRLIGAVEDQSALQDGRNNDHCDLQATVQASRRGEAVPKFTAPEPHLAAVAGFIDEAVGQPPVTITLREAEHTPHRNSNLPEWIKLAHWLEGRGEPVVFVRDTAKSREPLDGFITCHAASENLLMRCALYQSAKANLFVSNGPMMLAAFGDKPWLTLIEVQENGDFSANTSKGIARLCGIAPGEQWPWSTPQQRIVWARDTFEMIRDAYAEHIAG